MEQIFKNGTMAQIDDFFMRKNRVEGITDADYQNARPYVEAAQAFAQTTYQSIYIIDYYKKNFLFVSDNPLFLCGRTAEEVRQKPGRGILQRFSVMNASVRN